jgi:hypothetical protein
MYGQPRKSGSLPAQFYIQSGWNNATARSISPDVRGYFLNDANVVIGTSNGLGSIPKGAAVAFFSGHEVALPLVQGTLSGFSNTGVLVTVPSPGNVNVYGRNGESVLAHITNLNVDSISDGAGGYANPSNRIVGCNAKGDIKIIGQSSAPATLGDWGYWDSASGSFIDVSALTKWPLATSSDPIVKLWAISDTDEICATVIGPWGNSPTCVVIRKS